MIRRCNRHLAQELGADLVAEAARSAMDGHHALTLRQPENPRGFGVEYFADLLNLQVVVARAQRAHLVTLALAGAFGNVLGPGLLGAAVVLDAVEVARLAIALV